MFVLAILGVVGGVKVFQSFHSISSQPIAVMGADVNNYKYMIDCFDDQNNGMNISFNAGKKYSDVLKIIGDNCQKTSDKGIAYFPNLLKGTSVYISNTNTGQTDNPWTGVPIVQDGPIPTNTLALIFTTDLSASSNKNWYTFQ